MTSPIYVRIGGQAHHKRDGATGHLSQKSTEKGVLSDTAQTQIDGDVLKRVSDPISFYRRCFTTNRVVS